MRYTRALYIAALALAPQLCPGQELAFHATMNDPTPTAPSAIVRTSASAPVTTPGWQPKFDRWVKLEEFDFSMRYKSVTDDNGVHEFNNGQQRGVIDGKFKFDEEGRYALAFHASSGKSFNWSYADFIGGGNEKALNLEIAGAKPQEAASLIAVIDFRDTAEYQKSLHSGGWSFYMRRLYLDLEPIKGFEFQGGSLDINRGAGTEITTYDNDGYIDGERILIKRPAELFFDEASVTYAYFGDLYTPNMFERMDRFTQSNYHQFLLRKHAGKRLDASFDYTWQTTANTLHEDALVDTHESRVVDSVRAEFYQRLNAVSFADVKFFNAGGHGYAFTLDKKISRLDLNGGYADIDFNSNIYAQTVLDAVLSLGVNGDQYGLGNRIFVHPTCKIKPYLDASLFFTREFKDPPFAGQQIVWNRDAFNVGFNLDITKMLFPGVVH